jgi:hypothetical protein
MKFLKKKGRGNMKGKRVFKLKTAMLVGKGEYNMCECILYMCDRMRTSK